MTSREIAARVRLAEAALKHAKARRAELVRRLVAVTTELEAAQAYLDSQQATADALGVNVDDFYPKAEAC